MIQTAKLHDIAEGKILELEAEGITLTPKDIVEINALSWNIETPESRRLLSRGVPVFVGGVTLWPLTLYGGDWYRRVGCKLIGNDLQTYALAYAMIHGRGDGDELEHGALATTLKMIPFSIKLKCTKKELNVAIAEILDEDSEPELPQNDDDKKMSVGEFSANLVAACGSTPEFWEKHCTVGYAGQVLSAVVQQNKADDRPNENDPRIKGNIALGWCIEKIRERHLNNG